MSIVEGGFGVVASGSLTVYSKNICNCNLIHGRGGSDVGFVRRYSLQSIVTNRMRVCMLHFFAAGYIL